MAVGRYMERQRVWEWLALGNFLLGGAGGGLYIVALPVQASGLNLLSQLSAALVVAGLLCVMAEAGRPSRAVGVVRNIKTSWMSREALFASGFILFTALDTLILPSMTLKTLAWASALGYVVCQSFMPAAAKKIPAWNTPATAPLFIALSIAAGAGITSLASPAANQLHMINTALAASVLAVGASYATWPGATEYFRQALKREGNVIYLAGGLLITALAAAPAMLFSNQTAGLLLITGTSVVKYTIIIRMSYKLPVLPPLEALR